MKRAGTFTDKSVKYLGYTGAALGTIGIYIMAVIIFLNVILRYFFNKPLLFVDEYSAYLLVVAVFMGLAYTARAEAHINVEFVIRRLPKRARDGFDVITSLLALALMGVYVRSTWGLFIKSIGEGTKAPTPMLTPEWIPQTFLWLGLLFVSLELAVHIFKKARDVFER